MIGGTAGAGGCFAVDSVVGGAVVVEVSAGGAGGAGGCGVGGLGEGWDFAGDDTRGRLDSSDTSEGASSGGLFEVAKLSVKLMYTSDLAYSRAGAHEETDANRMECPGWTMNHGWYGSETNFLDRFKI